MGDVVSFRLSGCTNDTDDRALEQYCVALVKLKPSLAAALRSFWPYTISKPQTSMSAWATRDLRDRRPTEGLRRHYLRQHPSGSPGSALMRAQTLQATLS